MKPAGFLEPIEPPHKPFDQVGLDILWPFPLSHDSNKWVVVVTDYLTLYAETEALPRATASEVAQFFMCRIVLHHGSPSTLIADRWTAFTAQLMDEFFSVEQHQTSKDGCLPFAVQRTHGAIEQDRHRHDFYVNRRTAQNMRSHLAVRDLRV